MSPNYLGSEDARLSLIRLVTKLGIYPIFSVAPNRSRVGTGGSKGEGSNNRCKYHIKSSGTVVMTVITVKMSALLERTEGRQDCFFFFLFIL